MRMTMTPAAAYRRLHISEILSQSLIKDTGCGCLEQSLQARSTDSESSRRFTLVPTTPNHHRARGVPRQLGQRRRLE